MLTDEERAVLHRVDHYLAAGRDLKQWWDRSGAAHSFAEQFELGVSFNRPDTGYGFFDEIHVVGRPMPIMGNVQSMFFDRPKCPSERTAAAARGMREQLREYVLRYFMRVSDFRQPQSTIDHDRPDVPPYLRPFSLCPPEEPQRIGFGFSQIFYKLGDTGQIGRFPEDERRAIVDLRDIGQKYEWIVVKVRIFDFSFTYMPFGPGYPQIVMPRDVASYLVLTRDFITNIDNPVPGVLGRYGIGYAFIKDQTASLAAYGPGQFDAAIELIDFQVFDDGRVRVEMVFIVNRPQKMIHFSLNPINWGLKFADFMSFGLTSRLLGHMQGAGDQGASGDNDLDLVYGFIWLANALTNGQAAQQLCLSRDDVDKLTLVKHFIQHYQTMAGALQTWRQIPDWCIGEAYLPQWVVTGCSA
jgi:hypothetical protein